MTSGTTVSTPATAGNETINYSGPLTTKAAAAGASTFEGSGSIGTPLPGYFGQNFLINNLTASWDASSRATLSFTYRYGTHTIAPGSPHNTALAVGATSNGTVTRRPIGASMARSSYSTTTTCSLRSVRGRPCTTECTPNTG
jgi:hypothetical protein